MTDTIETFEEHAAMLAAASRVLIPCRQPPGLLAAFEAGWIAGRDWHRQRDEREVEEAVRRLGAGR